MSGVVVKPARSSAGQYLGIIGLDLALGLGNFFPYPLDFFFGPRALSLQGSHPKVSNQTSSRSKEIPPREPVIDKSSGVSAPRKLWQLESHYVQSNFSELRDILTSQKRQSPNSRRPIPNQRLQSIHSISLNFCQNQPSWIWGTCACP